MDGGTSAPPASPHDDQDASPRVSGPRANSTAVAPRAMSRPDVGRIRVDSYRRRFLPEIYIESPLLAQVIAGVSAVVIVVGTALWWQEVSVRFAKPDVIRPAWYRTLQWSLGVVGIAAASLQVAYAVYFEWTGRVWRRWRAVSILFLSLSSAWTALWLVDRFLLDQVFL
jgi:hypothetical protein